MEEKKFSWINVKKKVKLDRETKEGAQKDLCLVNIHRHVEINMKEKHNEECGRAVYIGINEETEENRGKGHST